MQGHAENLTTFCWIPAKKKKKVGVGGDSETSSGHWKSSEARTARVNVFVNSWVPQSKR